MKISTYGHYAAEAGKLFLRLTPAIGDAYYVGRGASHFSATFRVISAAEVIANFMAHRTASIPGIAAYAAVTLYNEHAYRAYVRKHRSAGPG